MATTGGSGSSTPTALRFLIGAGPSILLVSIALVTVAVAARRPLAAAPALLAGAALYWGMYRQPSAAVMDAVIAVGLLGWGSLVVWVFRGSRRLPSPPQPGPFAAAMHTTSGSRTASSDANESEVMR